MATLTAGQSATIGLDAWATLSLVVSGKATLAFTSGAENVHPSFEVTNATSRDFGPYGCPMSVVITAVDRSLTYTITGGVGGYQYDSSGNVTGLVGPDGATATLFPYNDGTRTVFRLPSNSWLQLGVSAQGAGKELVNFSRIDTNADAVARPTSFYAEQATNLGTTMTCDFHNIDALCYGGGSNTRYTANVGLYCIEGQASFTGTASQTLGKAVGVYGLGKSTSTNGTLSVSVGVQGTVQNTGAGTTTLGACFYARTPTVSAGTLTTAYGFYAEDILNGSTNYSIYTNAGRVRFFAGTAVPAGGAAGVGVTMSSTANLGVFFGSGVPTLAAAQGSLYLRTDGSSTSTRMYVNTDGGTTWTAVTTAA